MDLNCLPAWVRVKENGLYFVVWVGLLLPVSIIRCLTVLQKVYIYRAYADSQAHIKLHGKNTEFCMPKE
jgi:hypothetical protein